MQAPNPLKWNMGDSCPGDRLGQRYSSSIGVSQVKYPAIVVELLRWERRCHEIRDFWFG